MYIVGNELSSCTQKISQHRLNRGGKQRKTTYIGGNEMSSYTHTHTHTRTSFAPRQKLVVEARNTKKQTSTHNPMHTHTHTIHTYRGREGGREGGREREGGD